MHPYHHSLSSVKKWGGSPGDYITIHHWFDQSKEHLADFRHRAVRHHSEGIFEAEKVFGVVICNSDNRRIPVRFIGEQHVKEDLGCIPSQADWLKCIKAEKWMMKPGLSRAERDEITETDVPAEAPREKVKQLIAPPVPEVVETQEPEKEPSFNFEVVENAPIKSKKKSKAGFAFVSLCFVVILVTLAASAAFSQDVCRPGMPCWNGGDDMWTIGGRRDAPERSFSSDLFLMSPEELASIPYEMYKVRVRQAELSKEERRELYRVRIDGLNILKAKHKAWVKQVLVARAQAESLRRRQVIAWRRATGWYDARRNNSHGNIAYNAFFGRQTVPQRTPVYSSGSCTTRRG